MTKKQIEISYQLAEDVFNRHKTLKDAKEIGAKFGISPNSINYYCSAFRHMMNGTRHTSSIGTEIRDFFLSQIFSKYDVNIKINALNAFEQTIEYDENRHHCALHKNRCILEKYRNLL